MTTLVIGYGNTLRSDDGAGQRAAELVESWNIADVRSLMVHQLTPELATEIALAERVIFVDAIAAEQVQSTVKIEKLVGEDMSQVSGHDCHPRYLLSLTKKLYQKEPPAYWVLIPAMQFEFGETFSFLTQQSLEIALINIRNLLVSNAAC